MTSSSPVLRLFISPFLHISPPVAGHFNYICAGRQAGRQAAFSASGQLNPGF